MKILTLSPLGDKLSRRLRFTFDQYVISLMTNTNNSEDNDNGDDKRIENEATHEKRLNALSCFASILHTHNRERTELTL